VDLLEPYAAGTVVIEEVEELVKGLRAGRKVQKRLHSSPELPLRDGAVAIEVPRLEDGDDFGCVRLEDLPIERAPQLGHGGGRHGRGRWPRAAAAASVPLRLLQR